ncbi:platelet glycoprotein IX-like [Sceloporus undulatus]|uniref:platelet glycoprotein IX-like n=1 Tax=Sceloporus undulatus TaxID=8520 RepID=UPI001C4C41F3|nr:platelet glycoprotein IX-like [Sceloporus undulatus]
MDRVKISTAEGLFMLLLLNAAQATPCPPCLCEPLAEFWGGWTLDCSFLRLKEIPPLLPNVRILYLQNNSLTTVPSGALDHLNLKEVDFSNNPWHCDCSILYLKKWLEDFNQSALAKVICATPISVKTKALSQLNGNELEGCRKPLPIKCLDFFWRDIALIFMAIIAFILSFCILQRAKKLASEAARKLHSSEIPLLQVHDLENQKSK